MIEKHIVNIDFGQVHYNPAIIDYDFINKRPRGGSCRIDFFSHGVLSSSLDEIDFEDKIFIKKDNIFFAKGIFLIDFNQVLKKPDIIKEMISNLNISRLYLEQSSLYDITNIVNEVENIEIILMRFGCTIV